MEKTQINIVLPEGADLSQLKDVVIRTGDAEKLEPLRAVVISGTINAPADWLRDHPGANHTEAFVQLDPHKRSILYQSFPASFLNTKVTGELKLSKQLSRLRINDNETWSALKLAKHLKTVTALAADKAEHMKVVAALEKLKVKVNTQLEKFKADSGNAKFDYERSVESNLIPALAFSVPLFEGEPPIRVEATIIVEDVNQGDVVLVINSFDLDDMIDQAAREALKREEERFVSLAKEDQATNRPATPTTRVWTP